MLIESRGCSDHQDAARKLLGSMAVLARLLAHNAWTSARRETLFGKFSEKQLGSRCSSACLWQHSGLSATVTNECPQEPDLPSTSCGLFALRTRPRRCHYSAAFALSSQGAQTRPKRSKTTLPALCRSTKNCAFFFSGKHSGLEPEPLFASSFERRQATRSGLVGKEGVELVKNYVHK